MKRLDGDGGGGVDGGDMDSCGDDGDDVLYEDGVRRRLMSSSPSLSSSTSQRLYLVRLAGGETGSGVSYECCSLAVGAMTDGGGQAAMMTEGQCLRRRRRLRAVTVVVGVGKWQKRVTS